MRKFLILGLLAATAAVPTAGMAQDGTADVEISREERRAARQQQRQERREARQAAPPSGQIPEGAWIGNPNDPRMEAHRRRYERLERQNARERGTPEQFRDVVRRQGGEQHGSGEDHHGRRDEPGHRDLHRDYRRDHRELHRGDPSRREHREWHRDTQRDHRREHRDTHRDLHRDYQQEHRDLHRDDPNRREHRQWHREANRDHRGYHREWNREWRRDQRYDWRSYRNYNRYAYRVPTYYAPYRGYGYSRFSIGMQLDRLFWGRNYWINNPYQYRLPPAPYGYVWVRYYDDVLLVDTYSGRVVDVIHDFFWR